MKTKLSCIKDAMSLNDWKKAIALASKLPRLDKHRGAILSAHGAYTNPSFYNQIGKDVNILIEDGKKALVCRFGE